MPRPKAAAKPRAAKGAASAHKLADPLPPGEVFRDYCKKEWKLGKPIGAGGFGLIYLADENKPGPVSDNATFVMKLEPHSNGPLFCELHFYQRVAKKDLIDEYAKSNKLKHLGIPQFVATGSHENSGTKYRFMVMERCGTDLQKLFEQNGKLFPVKSVYLLGIKMLHALEYVHSKEYVHADIKASNILTGFGKGKDEVYLVDYGLAFKYSSDGRHKEYNEDPRRVHDGTIEFTSRDAHKGVVPSRRGDLEILGYCMLQWLCHTLPWEDKLSNKEYVRDSKIKHMNNVSGLMKKCLPSSKHDELAKYLQYAVDLDYDQQPDYGKCRQWFSQALKRLGGSESEKIVLRMTTSKSPTKTATKGAKKRRGDQLQSVSADSDSEPSSSVARKPSTPAAKKTTPKRRRTPASTTPKQRRTPASTTPKRHRTPASTTPRTKGRVTANGEIIPQPAVLPPGLINGHGDGPRKAASEASLIRRAAKRKAITSTTATQTSPGLRGLARSRNKKRRC